MPGEITTAALSIAGTIATTASMLGAWVKWGDSWERRKDSDVRVAAARQLAQAEAQAELARVSAERDSGRTTLAAKQATVDALIADRDAWRTAHNEEVEARRSAEQAAKNLMETSQLSLALLAALRDVVGKQGARE